MTDAANTSPSQEGVQEIVIVGGGLAGLCAALELVRLGLSVQLYEADDRLGGKAGSEHAPPLVDARFRVNPRLKLPDGVASDHGYHVFPQWYVQMRHLWAEIGITPDDVIDNAAFVQIPPAVAGVQQPAGAVQRPDLRQLQGICELVLQPDANVDDLTLQGFLYSRDYHRDRHPVSLDEFVLNALTIGEARISSRCARDVFRQWLPVFSQANWNGLRGSLQRVLIDRIEARVHAVARERGVRFAVRKRHRLTQVEPRAGGGAHLDFQTGTGRGGSLRLECPLVVLAIPLERLRTLLAPEAYDSVPEISALHHLRANVFSALDVHFEAKLPGLPEKHFRLRDSRYRITGLEIGQHWPELQRHAGLGSVIQFVVSDAKRLEDLDDASFTRVLAAEIARYLPAVGTGAVKYYVPHRNVHAPLFINEVGSWKFRPKSRGSLPGLYFAGDFVQNPTDVASMEGAVRSGAMAAEALRADHRPDAPAVVLCPPVDLPAPMQPLLPLYADDPVLARLMCFAGVVRAL